MTFSEPGRRPPKQLIGLPTADAEKQARELGWEVRVMRRGATYPAGPFRADRTNLHTDESEIVLDVSIG